MADLAVYISELLAELAEEEGEKYTTQFGQPLVGFVAASDPRIGQLKQVAHQQHMVPEDLLPNAKAVVAYYLPFTKGLAAENRIGQPTTREWAIAYAEANQLLDQVGKRALAALGNLGIKGAEVKPTHNFCEKTLVANWSHRHWAYLAGLGQFGLNHMLITSKGCAGRCGSFVIDTPIPGLELVSGQGGQDGQGEEDKSLHPCIYYRNGGCLVCVKNCPSGALTVEGLDRHRCYAYMLDHCRERFADIGVTDVCGKCINTPCAIYD